MVMVDGMDKKDVAELKSKIEKVDHVDSVVWYDTLVDSSVPYEMIPENIYDEFNSGDTTLMAVFFDASTSSDESMNAVSEIRKIGGKQCFVSGMTAFVEDLKELAEKEEPVYVAIAVVPVSYTHLAKGFHLFVSVATSGYTPAVFHLL